VHERALACEMISAAVAAVTVLRYLCCTGLLHLQQITTRNVKIARVVERGSRVLTPALKRQGVLAHLLGGCDILPRPSALPDSRGHCGECR
jgi:hypothetical protein